MSHRPTLSIIVPVLNESSVIVAGLTALAAMRQRGAELIVVDGGSDDNTLALATPLADSVLSAPRGRGAQLNAGAAHARSEVLLFLHADTLLPAGADLLISQALTSGFAWGRFDVHISGQHPMLKVVAAMMNMRSRWTGIATGDQALFVRRDVFSAVGGFPDQPLMEDIEISRRLHAHNRPACLRDRVITSGRRWETRGVWRTIGLMWWLRWRYWRGAAAAELAKAYR